MSWDRTTNSLFTEWCIRKLRKIFATFTFPCSCQMTLNLHPISLNGFSQLMDLYKNSAIATTLVKRPVERLEHIINSIRAMVYEGGSLDLKLHSLLTQTETETQTAQKLMFRREVTILHTKGEEWSTNLNKCAGFFVLVRVQFKDYIVVWKICGVSAELSGKMV